MHILKRKFSIVLKSVVILTLLVSFSCSSDDDGGNGGAEGTVIVSLPDSAVGEYTGELSYTSGALPTENDSGTATIVKTGDNVYKITFSDGVPELTGFRFIASNGNFTSASTGNSSEGVSINGSSLSVGVTEGTSNWAFSGSK